MDPPAGRSGGLRCSSNCGRACANARARKPPRAHLAHRPDALYASSYKMGTNSRGLGIRNSLGRINLRVIERPTASALPPRRRRMDCFGIDSPKRSRNQRPGPELHDPLGAAPSAGVRAYVGASAELPERPARGSRVPRQRSLCSGPRFAAYSTSAVAR
jgi:hypothetical protein